MSSKNITLINPSSPFLINERVFLPLGILYLASVLRNKGHNVDILDLSNESHPNKKLDKIDSDIVGITSTSAQFKEAEYINNYIKSNLSSDITTVIGGAHPTICPSDCLNLPSFDYIIRGEGEQAILDVVNDNNKPLSPIIIRKSLIKDVDTIPYPARDLINHHSYNYSIDGEPATNMMTSRGCPYKCIYCDSHNIWGRKVRFHSPKYVLGEISQLMNLGYSAVQIFDDTFILNRKRVEKICEGTKKLDIKFRCFIRSNLATKSILKMLKESGCVEIAFGAESGSQEILNTINKQTTIEQNTRTVKLAHELGLRVKAFLMIGLPGENYETVEQTKNWILTTKPDDFDYCILQPFPGTELYDQKYKYDINWNGADVSKSWYKGIPGHYTTTIETSTLSSKEIIRLRDEVEQLKGGI